METENENIEGMEKGVQKSLEELSTELREIRHEAQKSSRFKIIEPGKSALMTFTGNIYERQAIINGATVVKLDFEITEATPNGEHRIFSVSKTPRIAAILVDFIKAKKLGISITRQGSGIGTRYFATEVQL